jgi:hypothetical protein
VYGFGTPVLQPRTEIGWDWPYAIRSVAISALLVALAFLLEGFGEGNWRGYAWRVTTMVDLNALRWAWPVWLFLAYNATGMALWGTANPMMIYRKNIETTFAASAREELTWHWGYFVAPVAALGLVATVSGIPVEEATRPTMQALARAAWWVGLPNLFERWDVMLCALVSSFWFGRLHGYLDRLHGTQEEPEGGHAVAILTGMFALYLCQVALTGGVLVAVLLHIAFNGAMLAGHLAAYRRERAGD